MNFTKKKIAIAFGILAAIIIAISLSSKDQKIEQEVTFVPEGAEIAVFAGGCFWCIEAPLQETEGVFSAVSGYSGGKEGSAQYQLVASGLTKHREVVQVAYDDQVVSYKDLVELFFKQIDPIDDGGQFADRGRHYTTAVYYSTDEEKEIIESVVTGLNESGKFSSPVVTEIIPTMPFYPAEEYHQDYYLKSGDAYKQYETGSGRKKFKDETWKNVEEESVAAENVATKKKDYDYTDQEIKELLKNLDPFVYKIVAEGGTEKPFKNAYWDNKAEGIYVDVVTGEPLFSSTHKYDSGTGWPSFWKSINDNSLTLHEDKLLTTTRTEIRSKGGHVGHVFNDGPEAQGGKRFCANSASLLFVAREDMLAQGYGDHTYLFGENEQEVVQETSGDRYLEIEPDDIEKYKGKRVVLFFHASWCPSCRSADKNIQENIDEMPDDLVILKVDYDQHKNWGRKEYKVAFQHTFVELDIDGNQVKKWSGGDFDEIFENISS